MSPSAAAQAPSAAPPDTVRADSYLTLHYRVGLAPDAVDVVNTFGGKPATIQLGAGQFAPTLEERLIGLAAGSRAAFDLPAGEAFGPRNPDLVRRVPKRLLEAESERSDYSPGDVVEFNAPGGGRYAGVFQSLESDYAVFDFNHPLAGRPVRFEVEILGII